MARPARDELLSEDGDRPLADLVDVDERAPLRLAERFLVDGDAEPLQLLPRAPAEVVVPERRVERRAPVQAHELDRGDRSPAGRLLSPVERVHDLAGPGHAFDPHELAPLDVAHDRDLHPGNLTDAAPAALDAMMEAMRVPPFERFYESHRDEIYAFLVRRLRRHRADDAFQETFLRALRAYGRLEHARNLRAWAFTIADRVSLDELRRTRPYEAPADWVEAADDAEPAYAELDHLTRDLPPTERAAVVLRYGYDFDYRDIGAALGSNADAARAAASSGVRRLRRKEQA